jgi:hypothetical protein
MNTSTIRGCFIAVAACAGIAACASTQSSPPPAAQSSPQGDAVARIITRADVEHIERTLADDSMQGRQVGTPGAAKASDYIAAEMKRIGLKPGGDNGTYFQNVAGSMANVIVKANLDVDGKALAFNSEYAVVPGNTAPRPVTDAQAVYGGVIGDTVNLLPVEQAAGKVVVLLPAPPAPANAPPRARPARGAPPRAPANSAARYNTAAAVITANIDGYDPRWIRLISDPMKATTPRGNAANANSATPQPVQPSIRMTTAAAAKLFGGRDLASLPLGATGGKVSGTFLFRSIPQPTWTRNVIGIIPGSDPSLKDQWILIDAHYDHLGMRFPPVNGDSVFNGADDDASGTTAVLEIARAMKKGSAPKRSMIFVATTGEEAGLIGTNYYLAHPYVPMQKLVANMEIEMIGRPDSLSEGSGGAWLTGYERSTMGDMLKAAGIRVFPDMRPTQNFFSRSDNIAFACAGIPAHTLSTFNLHTDYHQLTDDPNTVDYDHMTEVVRSGARAARLLADGPAPQWKPGKSPKETGTCRN